MNPLKRLYLGIGIAAVIAAITAVVKIRRAPRPADCVDGGVRHYSSGDDAPKTIVSSEITDFRCEFSLYAAADPGKLGCGKYKCSAVLQEGTAACSIRWQERTGASGDRTFTAGRKFLQKLQETVSAHDLVKHNGYVSRVSGLPDMYGASLSVRYASGESIYAYDNQHNFLTDEVMNDLFTLFTTWNESGNTEESSCPSMTS